ncbi:hypothetical protein NKI20_17510 [Mesorhizobium sp. M0830]|uniref:hypothetical protein n=1 Tax=Mesorhizobium sp. M0830 TaxID=2957008 RepID=UPI0033381501
MDIIGYGAWWVEGQVRVGGWPGLSGTLLPVVNKQEHEIKYDLTAMEYIPKSDRCRNLAADRAEMCKPCAWRTTSGNSFASDAGTATSLGTTCPATSQSWSVTFPFGMWNGICGVNAANYASLTPTSSFRVLLND